MKTLSWVFSFVNESNRNQFGFWIFPAISIEIFSLESLQMCQWLLVLCLKLGLVLFVLEMDVGSREEDISYMKQVEVHSYLNECFNGSIQDDTDMSNVEGLIEQGHRSKPARKSLAKSASLPSAVPAEDDEILTALQRMFSEDLVQTYSRSISLPAPLKLVSALKGSRGKQGLPPKKLTVKWAPDVYDPPPTSVLHTVGNKRQQKSKKKKNDKKKNGKKGQKGNNAGRGNGGGKDNKRSRGGGNFDRSYKPLPEVQQQDRLTSSSIDLDGFNVGSPTPDPHCGSSFMKKSPTKMLYSVAEAL